MIEEEDLPKLKIKFSVQSTETLSDIMSYLVENYEVDGWQMTKEITDQGILVNLYPKPNEAFFIMDVKQDIIAVIIESRRRFSKNN